MSVTKWNPINEMNRFFDDVFENLPTRIGFDLAVDLYQDGDNLVAEMSLPGIDIANTEVNVLGDGDILRVSGHREEKAEKKDKNFFSKEIRRGSFERSIRLPVSVKADETNANYKDGVLRVVMPQRKVTEGKKVKINHEG